jgi:NAD(P)H dehydrogenase (quinone)
VAGRIGGSVKALRVLVVYAHPLDGSLVSAAHVRVVDGLRDGGHEVDDLDLYAEKFDPVLSPDQMRSYVDVNLNTREVETYVERLRAAAALVLVYPVWFDGLPAIMHGYFQRVFLPGVATLIDEKGLFHPNLWNLKRMAAVCAYGETRAAAAKKRDPPRRFVRDNVGALIDPQGRFQYLALYGTDSSTPPRRTAFLRRVSRAFAAW